MKVSEALKDLENLNLHDLNSTSNGGYSAPTSSWQLIATIAMVAELKKLNLLLHCHNFMDIPHKLERIKRNTMKKRKLKVIGKPKLRVVR